MPEDALEELDGLKTFSSAALHLRVDVLFRLRRWGEAAEIAVKMTRQESADPGWWIQAAYATRRASDIGEAEAILLSGLELHPGNDLMLYNLACYACVGQRLEEARTRLRSSIAIHPATVFTMALRDPDLAPLWPWIAGLQEEMGAEKPAAE